MQISSNKAIITGNHYETFQYANPYSFGYKVKKIERNYNLSEIERKERQDDYILTSKGRAIRKIYRLAKGNMYRYNDTPHFITLTFNREMTNLKDANKLFGLFIKRYNYYLGYQLRYIAVPEYQKDIDFKGNTKENGGNIHYHIIAFNSPFIANPFLQNNLWKNGGTDICKGYRTKGLCRYMTKYISKSFEDIRYKGHKRYFFSLEEHTKIYKDEYRVKKILEEIKDTPIDSEIKYNLYDYAIKDKEVRKQNPKNSVIKREYLVGIGGVGGVVSPP